MWCRSSTSKSQVYVLLLLIFVKSFQSAYLTWGLLGSSKAQYLPAYQLTTVHWFDTYHYRFTFMISLYIIKLDFIYCEIQICIVESYTSDKFNGTQSISGCWFCIFSTFSVVLIKALNNKVYPAPDVLYQGLHLSMTVTLLWVWWCLKLVSCRLFAQ